MQILPYNAQGDPGQYAAQFMQNMFAPVIQQMQMQQQRRDLTDIGNWARGGFTGQMPRPRTPMGQQMVARMMDPLYQIRMETERTRGAYYRRPRAGVKATKDEVNYWTQRGYSLKDAQKNARLAAEIGAGITPRKSTRKHYDNMTDVEKMDFLTNLKNKAEGQYFGVEGGNVEARNPQQATWAQEELEKLPMFKEQQTEQIPAQEEITEPPTEAELIKKGYVWKEGHIPPESPVGLEDIWDDLDDEEKLTAMSYLQEGVTAEEIVNYFNLHK